MDGETVEEKAQQFRKEPLEAGFTDNDELIKTDLLINRASQYGMFKVVMEASLTVGYVYLTGLRSKRSG